MTAVLEAGPEVVQVVDPFLDGGVNHEIKLAAYLTFGLNPTQPFLPEYVAQDMNRRQSESGEDVAWRITKRDVQSYCDKTLGPVAGAVSSPDGRFWQADPEHADLHMALAGAVGTWSYLNQEYSVQHLLGSSGSPTEQRAPSMRFRIFGMLLDNLKVEDGADPNPPLSMIDITSALGDDSTNGRVKINLKTLSTYDYLELRTNRRDNNPEVTVVSTDVRPNVDRSKETELLIQAIGGLGVGATVTVNEIVDRAAQINGKADKAALAKRLRGGLHSRKEFPGLQLKDETHPAVDEQSAVEITKHALGPVSDLVNAINSVIDGSGLEECKHDAVTIATTPEIYRTLIEKGHSISSRENPAIKKENLEFLTAIACERGSVTAEVAQRLLEARHERKYTVHYVRSLLNTLVSRNRLGIEKVYTDEHSGIASKSYKFPKQQAAQH